MADKTEPPHISQQDDDLLPNMVDRLARENPDAVYGLWPVAPTSYDAGFRAVTYSQLANVINGLAKLLVQSLGPGQDGEALIYVGPNDVRLTALVLASIKAGYMLALTSPRNSPPAHRAIFEALKCRTFITTDPPPPPALTIVEAVKPERQLTLPSVEELLQETYPAFAYNKTFKDARWEPMVSFLEPPTGVTSVDQLISGKRILVTVPSFHGAGIGLYLLWAIPFGSIIVAPAATGIVTAQGVVEALKHTPFSVAVMVPSVVAELAQDPELLNFCAEHIDLILYIGGDLPQAIGDRVAAKIKLRCWWGASECGMPNQLVSPDLDPKTDWRYIQFHPSVGAAFEPVAGAEDAYELVMKRDDRLPQLAFSIRGQQHLEEYRTKDLFARHPTLPNAFCWKARADDIIVFLNGEKTNPVSMEHHIVASHPELSGALVLGAQRSQAALLIQPTITNGEVTTAGQAALIERVWPSVQEANTAAPAHARVEKALILVTTPDRPLILSGKGTIQRRASLAQYESEIEVLYANADVAAEDLDERGPQLDPTNANAVTGFVRDSLRAVGVNPDGDEASFFDQGMDSLQGLQLTRALRRGLHRPGLGLSTIYQNPSIEQLVAVLVTQSNESNDADLMEPLLTTYRELVHQIPEPQAAGSSGGKKPVNVVLTGSTGSIGTFLVYSLLSRPGIGHIFVLNRSADGGRAAQHDRFTAAGLPTDELDTRVTFIAANLSQPHLGVDAKGYAELRSRASLIIHNAWPVNFNLPLAAFRPQLTGLVNLLSLASAAAAQFVFISSVSAVGGVAGAAPEKVLYAMDTPYENGYARSKFLSELLCDAAAKHLGPAVPITIARVGQVAGAVRVSGPGSVWNRSEWLPSLVITSLMHLGCLPDSLGSMFSVVDWVPSDMLADVVVDLALAGPRSDGYTAQVFNLRNPRPTEWKDLLPAITEEAHRRLGRELAVVSSLTWLERLIESDEVPNEEKAGTSNINPAVKLIDFYRGLFKESLSHAQPMVVEAALVGSATFCDMPPVSSEWVKEWIKEWIRLSSRS